MKHKPQKLAQAKLAFAEGQSAYTTFFDAASEWTLCLVQSKNKNEKKIYKIKQSKYNKLADYRHTFLVVHWNWKCRRKDRLDRMEGYVSLLQGSN